MVQAISVDNLFPVAYQISNARQCPATYSARSAFVLQLRAEPPLCEQTFREWGEQDPERLLEFLLSDTRLGYVVIAALVAQEVPQARDALLSLVDHENAAVQEAAVMALEGHPGERVERVLRAVAEDSNRRPGVRDAAVAVLDVLCD